MPIRQGIHSAWCGTEDREPAAVAPAHDHERSQTREGGGSHGAEVDIPALVIPGGHGSELLELSDGSFHRVAIFVPCFVESRRPPAAGTPAQAGGLVVLLLRDHVPDTALAEAGADLPVAVCLVSAHAVRGAAGAAEPRAGNADFVHARLELGAVRPLPGRDEQGQGAAAAPPQRRESWVSPPRERPRASPGAPPPPTGVAGSRTRAGELIFEAPLEEPGGTGGGFVGAPATCWWARTTVESTLMFQSISPSASATAWTCWRSLS